jgi:hypothetical protein
VSIFEAASPQRLIVRNPYLGHEQHNRKRNQMAHQRFPKPLPRHAGVEKDFAPERHRPKRGLSGRRRLYYVGQVSQEDAMRWFQFDQQAEARPGFGAGAWFGTGRKSLFSTIHPPHARPVVFALRATTTTHLVVAAVGGSQRPEKLVDTDAGHKTCPVRLWGPGRLPEVAII